VSVSMGASEGVATVPAYFGGGREACTRDATRFRIGLQGCLMAPAGH